MRNGIDVRPRNWLVPVTLVLLRENSSHGYALLERVGEFGFEDINPGTLYRTLRQLEQKKLCRSEWETSHSSGPACRVYSITDEGEAFLDSWAERCKKYQHILDSFFLAHTCR